MTYYKHTHDKLLYYKDKHFVHERKGFEFNTVYSMVYRPRTQFCAVNGKQHFDFPTEREKENRDENMRVIKQNFSILWLSIYLQDVKDI